MHPIISTTILNWNRGYLLRRTLESYFRTISVPFELFVIDNNSKDNSRNVIQEFCAGHSQATAVFLDENRGGEAINVGLERSQGAYLHISENDIEYLPGWCDAVIEKFETFPELGQLSLFGPVPTDEEVWEVKPCALRHSRGNILYTTTQNVGTTSVLRRELWDQGVRLHNYPVKRGKFLFPDDGRLSSEILCSGKWVAWSDRYLVRNLGHFLAEVEEHAEYYHDNYYTKDWLGLEGFAKRIDNSKAEPRPTRTSFLYGDDLLFSAEKSLPSEECAHPQRWSMIDGNTAEIETLEFLYALVRLLKPEVVIETASWHGHMTMAIGRALKQNGFGHLVTFETDGETYEVAADRVKTAGLKEFVELRNQSPVENKIFGPIDLLILDSELGLRAAEFQFYQSALRAHAIVVFHDTSSIHRVVREDVDRFVAAGLLSLVNLPTPRGLSFCQYQGESIEAKKLANLQREIESRDRERTEMLAVLESINRSVGWKLVQRYRGIKDRLIRPGTFRRRLYDRCLIHLKIH